MTCGLGYRVDAVPQCSCAACVTILTESSPVLLNPGYERSFFRRLQILQLCLTSAEAVEFFLKEGELN